MAHPPASPIVKDGFPTVLNYQTIRIPRMLVDLGLAQSTTEAERLIKSNAVEIDHTTIPYFNMIVINYTDGSQAIGYR